MSKKASDQKERTIRLLGNKPPSVAVDGHGIKILDDGTMDIIFFQTIGDKKDESTAQIVTSLRMSKKGAGKLQSSIAKQLEKLEK